jgi:hypothetical protein
VAVAVAGVARDGGRVKVGVKVGIGAAVFVGGRAVVAGAQATRIKAISEKFVSLMFMDAFCKGMITAIW